jgi:mono/diheme cytochrome c family protein
MRRILALAALAVLAGPAPAQDEDRGRLLYETHCTGCHYERVHKRERDKSAVRTLAQLRVEVARRAADTRRPFTVDDLDDIAEYLNRSYYRLQK